MPAIGRIANFSSLRKHRPKEYQIYESYFGKSQSVDILDKTLNNDDNSSDVHIPYGIIENIKRI